MLPNPGKLRIVENQFIALFVAIVLFRSKIFPMTFDPNIPNFFARGGFFDCRNNRIVPIFYFETEFRICACNFDSAIAALSDDAVDKKNDFIAFFHLVEIFASNNRADADFICIRQIEKYLFNFDRAVDEFSTF